MSKTLADLVNFATSKAVTERYPRRLIAWSGDNLSSTTRCTLQPTTVFSPASGVLKPVAGKSGIPRTNIFTSSAVNPFCGICRAARWCSSRATRSAFPRALRVSGRFWSPPAKSMSFTKSRRTDVGVDAVMDREQARHFAEEWIAAWNSHDLERISRTMKTTSRCPRPSSRR